MKKMTKENIKKHARKVRNVTEEEYKELQEGYGKLMGGVRGMDTPGLLGLCVIGLAAVLLFNNRFIDLAGLLVFAYAFYLFVHKSSHQEGYFEGYYDHKCTVNGKGDTEPKGDKAKE